MKKQWKIIEIGLIVALIISSYATISTAEDDDLQVMASLSYEPSEHNFLNMIPGETGSTTFEIWRSGGCCSVNYQILEDISWIEVNPSSGTSNGERDLITVSIDTTGLQVGPHIETIYIQSNEGSGSFNVKVNIVSSQEPVLAFSPDSYDFGSKPQGNTYYKTLDIWNRGKDPLIYTITESCDWVTLSTNSGESVGEYDHIKVTISTVSLDYGRHTCDITISSNGGTGIFTVNVTVGDPDAAIEIEFTGGVGLKTIVKNVGDLDAEDVTVDIKLDGGLLFSEDKMSQTFSEIKAGSSKEISMRVFGLGMGFLHDTIKITVDVEGDDISPVTKTADMKLLLFLTIIS